MGEDSIAANKGEFYTELKRPHHTMEEQGLLCNAVCGDLMGLSPRTLKWLQVLR